MTVTPRPDDAPVIKVADPSQATQIEQARVTAEVQAAVTVAQAHKRSTEDALREMHEATGQLALAERAFFSFPRSGEAIEGASIDLARELARVWGNIQYGITELKRDLVKHESEMRAEAWDLQANTRVWNTFTVPHKRDTKKERGVPILDLRDVYENNANMGARRVRECIFAVLPIWFTKAAEARCRETVDRDQSEVPIAVRRAQVVAKFAGEDVTQEQLEARQRRKLDQWTPRDISQLGVLFGSLAAGTITRGEAFPDEPVTADEMRAAVAAPSKPPEAAAPAADAGTGRAVEASESRTAPREGPDGWPEAVKPGEGKPRGRQ